MPLYVRQNQSVISPKNCHKLIEVCFSWHTGFYVTNKINVLCLNIKNKKQKQQTKAKQNSSKIFSTKTII